MKGMCVNVQVIIEIYFCGSDDDYWLTVKMDAARRRRAVVATLSPLSPPFCTYPGPVFADMEYEIILRRKNARCDRPGGPEAAYRRGRKRSHATGRDGL